MRQMTGVFVVTLPLLVLGGCGGDTSDQVTNDQGTTSQGSGAPADESAAAEKSATDEVPAVATSAEDIHRSDPSNLEPGGTLRLPIVNFAENWNPLHIDGNNAEYSKLREPL